MTRQRIVTSIIFLVVLAAGACQSTPDPTTTGPTQQPATVVGAQGTSAATTIPQATTAPGTAPPLVSTPTTSGAPTTQAQPTATQPIPGLIGPDNFPPNVNPLTGETVQDPSALDRRPLAIKISNYPSVVRPQSGLNQADLIFEHYAEGGVTRFTAIFYTHDANPVGSIRSARLIDLELPKMYDAAFAYSGASGPVRLMVRDSAFFDRVISPDFAHGGFYRIEDPDKAVEHTLFTDTPRLRAILDERGLNTRPQFQTNMVFHPDPPQGGIPVNTIEVRYAGTIPFWRYDPASGRYLRSTDGAPHLDANTGHQLSFKNVVVIAAHHEDTGILEDQVGGGHYSTQIQVWGEGPVSIFRDGQRYDGRWRRQNEGDMLTFYDQEGQPLPLAPGNTFFQVVPLGFEGLITGQ